MATRAFTVDVPAGRKTTVHLFVPPTGTLKNLRVADQHGTEGFSFKLYTRKGAADSAVDKNADGGEIATITNSSGSALVTFAEAHNITSANQSLYIKGTGIPAYDDLEHSIATIVSDTVIRLETTYTSSASEGYAQTIFANFPLLSQAAYEIETETVTAGQSVANIAYPDGLYYENRDPGTYGSIMSWDAGLYLELDPAAFDDSQSDEDDTKRFEIVAVVL